MVKDLSVRIKDDPWIDAWKAILEISNTESFIPSKHNFDLVLFLIRSKQP
jgi:hypothetical protein